MTVKSTMVSLLLATTACSVGPDYKRADAPVATQFKELDGWKPSSPQDAVDRGSWWTIYKDPVLDDLEKQIDISNQTLKQSEAAYRQARAVVDQARASFFPTLTGNGSAQRSYEGPGASRGFSSFTVPTGTTGTGTTGTTGTGGTTTTTTLTNALNRRGGSAFNSFSAELQGSWDLDVWGRIRRTVEGDVASAQASAADLASARLSAQATVATDYIQLRYQEQLKTLLETTAVDFHRSLEITQNQYNAGVAAKADVLSAQTQFLGAQAQAINAGVLRATLEHAIAVLIGKPAGDFSIGPGKLPDLCRAIGDSMREFKRATSDLAADHSSTSKLEPQAATSTICEQCKASLPANSRFCGSCGASTEAAPRVAALV